MKIDLDAQVIGFDGEPIKTSEDDDTPISVGKALEMACLNANPEKHGSGEQKYKIYKLLQKLQPRGIVDVKAEDIVTLKTLVGDIYAVAVVGPVFDILEPSED